MELQVIGHASLLIRTRDVSLLMDPVFWDPFQEGLFEVWPRRRVSPERMPAPTMIVISHRHLDHFDLRTLSALPRDVDVLIPRDPLLQHYLERLGFDRVHALRDYTEVRRGNTRLFTTGSSNPVPEFGLVIADDSGVLWNMVDTVVPNEALHTVRSRFGRVDLVLAGWQPMLEGSFQQNQELAFPHKAYWDFLRTVIGAAPRAVAPGSNGFRYLEGHAWLNHMVFPVARERFCEDIRHALPSVETLTLDPGDTVRLDSGKLSREAGACPWIDAEKYDPHALRFLPVATGGQLVDPVPEGDAHLEQIRSFVEGDLRSFFDQSPALEEHRRWGVSYQLDVIAPSRTRSWTFRFGPGPVELSAFPSALAGQSTLITASALAGLINGSRGWDYAMLGGYYRTFSTVCRATPHGLLRPDPPLMEPLFQRFPYDECLEAVLDQELKRWTGSHRG